VSSVSVMNMSYQDVLKAKSLSVNEQTKSLKMLLFGCYLTCLSSNSLRFSMSLQEQTKSKRDKILQLRQEK
jgi:hypothetical protein